MKINENYRVTSINYSSNGQLFVIGTSHNILIVYDTITLEKKKEIYEEKENEISNL